MHFFKNIYLVALFILISSQLTQNGVFGQQRTVPNFPVQYLANQKANLADFNGKILILDFFGTWCAPCVRAIPHLEEIQKEFKDEIAVQLISIESRERLQKFVDKRPQFGTPIIVDSAEVVSSFIKPPSYPYTILLNKELSIVATVSTEQLTNKYLDSLLKTISNKTNPPMEAVTVVPVVPITPQQTYNGNEVEKLASDLLLAVKTGDAAENYIAKLSELSRQQLIDSLQSDQQKIAFWLNIYNAFTNYQLKKDPTKYQNRKKFFKSQFINIAGKNMSLDDVEHGILRRSKNKLSYGYLNKWFVSKFERQHRVKELDWRIHFALNCGAKSCPPISFYSASKLNDQLDVASKNYLTSECSYNTASNKIEVPVLMSWFRKDFGGKKQIVPILRKYNIIQPDTKPIIKFKKYDWSLSVENYTSK